MRPDLDLSRRIIGWADDLAAEHDTDRDEIVEVALERGLRSIEGVEDLSELEERERPHGAL